MPFTVYVSGRNTPDQSRSTGVQHPEVAPGRSFSSIVSGSSAGCSDAVKPGPVGTPDRYFDPCGFVLPPAGFYGNAGRNILIGPRLVNFDFSVTKKTRVPMGEAGSLEFHADFFNLLNHANFAVPRAPQGQVLNPATGAYVAGAGKITNTVSSSRQLQFGLKLVF